MSQGEQMAIARARQLSDARQARDRALGRYASLMGEPAWDLLLDLFIAHHDRLGGRWRHPCRSDPDVRAPNLQWVAILRELGLLRCDAPGGGLEAKVALTPAGISLVSRAVLAATS